ncbi:uncharacterized protein LOC123546280 [Mercenaria mercenaria]|uniref:uncharacterized protein LOC123546280 n=1 Tax=Mercenaria mercenaria TaxID=6596 RepID=UPI00234F7EAE|nr:uncharacterized protein LOC123546280 [Mercenaria mercenaria]
MSCRFEQGEDTSVKGYKRLKTELGLKIPGTRWLIRNISLDPDAEKIKIYINQLNKITNHLHVTRTTIVHQPGTNKTNYIGRKTIYIGRNSTSTNTINVTVVTAFFDIGNFQKNGSLITANIYFNWISKLRYLQNPLIVYTNSKEFKDHVKHMRNIKRGETAIRVINITSSWAFQNNNQIKEIFDSPSYQKYFPNTVHSLYACAQHAKYDVLERVVKENYFKTNYYMWLDVGYFRDRMSDKLFYIGKPKNFNDSKIAVSLVDPKQRLTNRPYVIFRGNLVWVGGGLVFGDRNHIIKFSKDFKRAVQYFLSQGLMNTDQQVVYAMYTTKGREVLKPEVELQLYKTQSQWFYLGNSMVREIDH